MHIQHCTYRVVVAKFPSFYKEPHQLPIFFMNVASGMAFIYWSQHYLLRSENLRGKCAMLILWQQAIIKITQQDHSIITCSLHLHKDVILSTHPIHSAHWTPSLPCGCNTTLSTWHVQVLYNFYCKKYSHKYGKEYFIQSFSSVTGYHQEH